MSAATATMDQADAWRPAVNPWIIALAVTLATFMEVLDTSIANVALPHIAGSLSAGQDESTWVLTSYLVSNAIVLPLSGWLSSIVGRKNFYMGCVALFTISSFLCGLAPNLADADHLPHSAGRWRRRLAAQRASHSRRYFSSRETRHGICRLWNGGRHRSRNRPHPRRLDHRQLHLALDFLHQHSRRDSFDPAHLAADSGSALLQAPQTERNSASTTSGWDLWRLGLGALQIVLDKGQREDWFESHFIITLSIICAAALIFVVIWEWRHKDPIIDLHLFRDRTFGVSNLLMFMLGFALLGSTLLIAALLADAARVYRATSRLGAHARRLHDHSVAAARSDSCSRATRRDGCSCLA